MRSAEIPPAELISGGSGSRRSLLRELQFQRAPREGQGVSPPDLEWTFGWLAMIVDNQNQDDQNVAETRTAIVNNCITSA